MKKLLILFSLFIFSLSSFGQLAFDDNFENGRLDTVFMDSSEYALAPVTNLHFRLTGATGQTPEFKIFDSIGHHLRFYHYMVYRYEGQSNWHFFDTGNKTGTINYYHFKNNTPFTHDTVYIAYWFPYTYTDLENFLNSISGSQHLIHSGAKSTSPGGRNLYGYQVTDTAYSSCYKKNVVITARQHPIEFINGYFVEGMTNYLLYGTDSIADFLRRNFHFYFYPMLNPDGVAEGLAQNLFGQGLNREWEDSLVSGGTPEVDSIRYVIWNETNQRVDWAIDIHSNPGSNSLYYWWGYTQNSPVPQWQIDDALEYVQSVSMYDTSSTVNSTSYSNNIQGNGANSSLTATNWFRNTFNAIAFTFEPTSEPMGWTGDNRYTIDQLKKAGKSLAMGFISVHDTLEAFGGTLLVNADTLKVHISGGLPPYSYSWTGPVSGNTSAIATSVPGHYSITVTDALGCTWTRDVNHQPLNLLEISQNPCLVHPNPSRGHIEVNCLEGLEIESIRLYNSMGKEIKYEESKMNNSIQLDFSTAYSGVYILKIITNIGVHTQQIVVVEN